MTGVKNFATRFFPGNMMMTAHHSTIAPAQPRSHVALHATRATRYIWKNRFRETRSYKFYIIYYYKI